MTTLHGSPTMSAFHMHMLFGSPRTNMDDAASQGRSVQRLENSRTQRRMRVCCGLPSAAACFL